MAMAKLVIFVVLSILLPALVSADAESNSYSGFTVHGSVYCDTCRAGFETNVTTYMPGAKVKLQCVNPDTQNVVYENSAVTDSAGAFALDVNYDHKEEICDVLLVSSSNPDCAEPCSGRGKSRVILTGNNGMPKGKRYANNMGFLITTPLHGCTELIKSYFLE